jgi:hypothetical protein
MTHQSKRTSSDFLKLRHSALREIGVCWVLGFCRVHSLGLSTKKMFVVFLKKNTKCFWPRKNTQQNMVLPCYVSGTQQWPILPCIFLVELKMTFGCVCFWPKAKPYFVVCFFAHGKVEEFLSSHWNFGCCQAIIAIFIFYTLNFSTHLIQMWYYILKLVHFLFVFYN